MDEIKTDNHWDLILKDSVQAYNTEHVHRATTLEEAREPTKKAKVKENLEQTRVMTRRYLKLVIGSKVAVLQEGHIRQGANTPLVRYHLHRCRFEERHESNLLQDQQRERKLLSER